MGDELGIGRRAFLAGGAIAAGAALSGGLRTLLTAPAGSGLDQDACLRALHASLHPRQRAHVCLPVDDPTRQLDGALPMRDVPQVVEILDPDQRELVRRLMSSVLSDTGRQTFGPLLALEAGGLDACTVTLYGEPGLRGAHAVINGAHLLMRTGTASDRGVVWNGPLCFGHQVGDGLYKLPGNAFVHQAELANALYGQLDAAQRAHARVVKMPPELMIQLQGEDGGFEGLALGELDDAGQDGAEKLLDSVLDSFASGAREAALASIEHHGGLAKLHLALYEDRGFYPDMTRASELAPAERARRGEPFFQAFRIEGPGTVFHFSGHSHVHAYLHVARDPRRQHAGETLAETARLITSEGLRPLLYAAMRAHTGAALAYYGEDIHARFCPGPVTTGLVMTVDPYDNRMAVVTAKGAALGEHVRRELGAQGVTVQPDRSYRIATVDHFAEREDLVRAPERIDRGRVPLRSVLIEHIRAHGLS